MTIAKLGTANNRVKDLYDLCLLAQRFEFEGALSAGRSSDILKHGTLRCRFVAVFHRLEDVPRLLIVVAAINWVRSRPLSPWPDAGSALRRFLG